MKTASLALSLLALSLVCAVTGNKLHDAVMNMNANANSVGPLKQAFASEGAAGLDESGPGGQTPLSESFMFRGNLNLQPSLPEDTNTSNVALTLLCDSSARCFAREEGRGKVLVAEGS